VRAAYEAYIPTLCVRIESTTSLLHRYCATIPHRPLKMQFSGALACCYRQNYFCTILLTSVQTHLTLIVLHNFQYD
jgi:hypothetical protein